MMPALEALSGQPAYRAAASVAARLAAAGYEAFFVGGCVRDLVLNRRPDDYDVVTDARPETIQSLFPKTYPVGAAFGVVLVAEGDCLIEVATYRAEADYDDGRRPSSVTFADARADVLRRDFTVNGLLLDPATGRILDAVGGLDDLRDRRLRAIGDPDLRFSEDGLRLLRAVRFAARLDFSVDPKTWAALRRCVPNIARISAERIRDELTKMISRPGVRTAIELLDTSGLLKILLPEVSALRGVEQPPAFHPEGDVWEHTLRMLALLTDESDGEADAILAWAALLHDIGKAETRSENASGVHFYGHVEAGGVLAGAILRRLKFSNADAEAVAALIAQHMRFMHVKSMRPSTLKRFLRQPDFERHLALHRLDCMGSHGMLDHERYCRESLARLSADQIRPPRLLTGEDLRALGLTPGPLFREILTVLEEAQLNGEIATPEEARQLAIRRWGLPGKR